MTLAGAGFVPCEVAYPARVLTAYPCVVRRDPTVCGTFPFGEQIGKVSLAGWEKNRGPNARALLFPHRGAHTPRLPVSADEPCEDDGRPAYVPAMRVAGRDYVTSSGTKPAPARAMASATGQPNRARIMYQ